MCGVFFFGYKGALKCRNIILFIEDKNGERIDFILDVAKKEVALIWVCVTAL